jgi:hypothetical protein
VLGPEAHAHQPRGDPAQARETIEQAQRERHAHRRAGERRGDDVPLDQDLDPPVPGLQLARRCTRSSSGEGAPRAVRQWRGRWRPRPDAEPT